MTLFCVGDSDQALYRFQGAKPELLTSGLDKWLPDIETIKLEINYRSTYEIIAKLKQLISHNYSDLGGPCPQEFMKNASGIKESEGWEGVQFTMHETAEQEATETANTINELIECGYSPGGFFIGARTRAQLGYIEGALVRAQIPFINIAGGSFWQSKHVADTIAMIKMACNGDKEAFKRINNIPTNCMTYAWKDTAGKFNIGDYCPARFLGAKFLAAINYDIEKIDSVYRAGRKGWQPQPRYGNERKLTEGQYDLLDFIYKIKMLRHENVGQIVRVIIDDCYEKYLKYRGAGDDGLSDAKLEDLTTVEEIASKYTSIDKFLSYVDEMVEAAEKTKNKDWGDYAVISTIHKLKCMERPVVFGIGWCEGVDSQSGRDVGLLPHTFSLSPPPNFGVLPSGEMSPMEDERRIGFVLISRAIERCYLSGIKSYRSYNLGPSRFIYEMELETNE